MDATQKLRDAANLRLLRRADPQITAVLTSATHSVLYELRDSPDSSKGSSWSKLDTEGSLFIVQRSTPCHHRLIVLNRNRPENFVADIGEGMQAKVVKNLLLLKTSKSVHGLYFHNEAERNEVNAMLDRIISGDVSYKAPVNEVATASLMSALGIGKSPTPQTAPAVVPSAPAPAKSPAQANHTSASLAQPLDKKALQLTLMTLIQDERFLDIIHNQYTKICSARAARGNQPNRR